MADTQRTQTELLALLADNSVGAISPQDMRDVLVSLMDTGWVDYIDTQYTQASPFSVTADTDTVLPNNAGSQVNTYAPLSAGDLYDGSVITGRAGDFALITLDMKLVPTSGTATYFETWLDIGGAVGELYRRSVGFPKGTGQERPWSSTTGVYNLDTWQANGATVFCRANGPVSVYDIRFVIHRVFRGGRVA